MVNSRKNRKNRKASRKNRSRRNNLYGGQAPVNWSNPGPMGQSLAQGVDFEKHHEGQHGGMGPYPGSVMSSSLPSDLAASARINPTLNAYAQIRGLSDQAGGRKSRRNSRKSRRNSRKNRRNSRKNRRNSRKNRRNSRKNRRNSRKSRRNSRKSRRNSQRGGLVRWGGMRGGAAYNLAVDSPSMVGESTKMLIPPSLQAQAGLHPEWKDAMNPEAWTPK